DLDAGHVVHLTLTISEAVTVTGTPTLLLNDGGTASYNSALSKPATGSLVFDYTLVSGQDTPDLVVSSFNNLAGVVKALARTNVNLTGAPSTPPGTLQIDSFSLAVTPMASSRFPYTTLFRSDLDAGHVVHLTLTISEALTVTGTPTLLLNDGGTASYNSALSNPAARYLVFLYSGDCRQNNPDFSVSSFNNLAGVQDLAGNNVHLTVAPPNP